MPGYVWYLGTEKMIKIFFKRFSLCSHLSFSQVFTISFCKYLQFLFKKQKWFRKLKALTWECLCSKDCFPLNSPPHGIYKEAHGIYKEAILVTTPCCLLKQSDISSAVSGYCSKGISNESSVFMKIIIFVIIVNLMIKLGKGVPKKGGWSYKTWTICFFFHFHGCHEVLFSCLKNWLPVLVGLF